MKLLIIEDEISLLKSIHDYFSKEDFICDTASNFEDGKEKISIYNYDCIILDINLPGGSGLKLIKHIRELNKQDGVIIISARNSIEDKVTGLELGGDDYLTKPFHLAELSARVKSLVRRKVQHDINQFFLSGFAIDLLSKEIKYNSQQLGLTKQEYNLLFFMINNKSRVVSRQAIAEHLTGEDSSNLDSFDFIYSHIKNLKRKLKEKANKDLIKTVYGLGYKLEIE